MKIVQYVGYLSDGGAESLVRDYAIVMTQLGHDVTVITTYPPRNTANYRALRDNNIKVISIFKSRSYVNRIGYRLLQGLYVAPFLLCILKRIHPDVIHVHMEHLHTLSPIVNHLSCKVVYTCHNEVEYYFGADMKDEYKAARLLIDKCNMLLIALHDKMAEDLQSKFPSARIIVINNGIDFSRYLNIDMSRTEIRKNIDVPKDAFLIGHVGRFTEQKNHKFLVDVFEQVSKINPNSHLLLVGVGPLLEITKKQLEDKKLLSKTTMLANRSDIPYLLKAMDVFLMPSLFEGLSIALLEAQVAGVRCVVSNKMNSAVYLSYNTIPLDLSQSLNVWAAEVLNTEHNGCVNGDINNFEIHNIVSTLISYYNE